MSIYVDELISSIGQELFDTAAYSYTVYGSVAVWIEGHKGIKTFSEQKVCFSLGKKRLEICGENLLIRRLTKDCALISGRIVSVEVVSA